jgi:hypothetical protein
MSGSDALIHPTINRQVVSCRYHRDCDGLLAFLRAGENAKPSEYDTVATMHAVYLIVLTEKDSFGLRTIGILQDAIRTCAARQL